MIVIAQLQELARARLKDARVLYAKGRYDGAVYVCGYAVELALKARICQTLRWAGFPQTRGEFDNYRSYQTHNLEVLLHLSGIEQRILLNYLTDWSIVSNWTSELRYSPSGTASQLDAKNMIDSTANLLRTIL
jgi:HEPN domain-containing protein